MSEHRFTMRLDDRYDDERAAWRKLNDIQRRSHLSFNRIVVDAINAYDNNYLRLAADDKEQLVASIADAVSDKLQQVLPAYLAGYAAGAAVPVVLPVSSTIPTAAEKPIQDHPVPDDDIPDFSGSVMDFDFMGS